MKLMEVYLDVSMSLGFPGLKKLSEYDPDDGHILFINKARTAFKMLTPAGVLLHYKSPDARRSVSMDAIKYLPACVDGKALNYDAAVKASIIDGLAKRQIRRKR